MIGTVGMTCTNISITENKVNVCYQGIKVSEYSYRITVSNNKVSNSTDNGIFSASGNQTDLVFSGNSLDTVGSIGMNLVNAVRVAVIGNIIRNVATNHGMWVQNVDYININSNVIDANTNDGIYLNTVTSVSLVGNQIGNNAQYGLNYDTCIGVAYANLFYSNGTANVNKAAGSDLKGVIEEP